MDNRIDMVFIEYRRESSTISDISFVEDGSFPTNGLDSIEHITTTITKVIDDDEIIS